MLMEIEKKIFLNLFEQYYEKNVDNFRTYDIYLIFYYRKKFYNDTDSTNYSFTYILL